MRWHDPILSFFLSIAFSVAAIAAEPVAASEAAGQPKPKVTIAKDTTYITAPIEGDGYPNYVAALNRLLSEGVTPENNAAALLQRAFGPATTPVEHQIEMYKQLGIDPLPAKGDYFVTRRQWIDRWSELDKERRWLEDFATPMNQALERPWSEKEFPIVAEWLSQNEMPLQLILQASARPKYFYPLFGKETNPRMRSIDDVSLEQFWMAKECLITRAMLNIELGKSNAAQQDLLAVHRLARLVPPSSVTAIQTAFNLEHKACLADSQLAHFGRLTSRQALQYKSDLEKLPPFASMADAIDGGERLVVLAAR